MSYPLVDVHAHMDHEGIDLKAVLGRAREAGVKAIISNGTNRLSNQAVLKLAKEHDIIKAACGFYPIDLLGLGADEAGLPKQEGPINVEEELEWIKKQRNEIVAIGEVGMDFHWDKEQHKQQEENFHAIIELARKIKKPLIIHSRKAEAKVVEILETQKFNNADMHCFCGKKGLVKRSLDLGLKFSIPANIHKALSFQMIVNMAPIHQLLTETDSPWLSPNKPEPNEPKNVQLAIQKIAELKGLDEKETALMIYKNYQDLFE